MANRRRRRSRALDQNRIRRRQSARSGRARRPRHALWRARTRHGRHRERPGAVKTASVRRDLSHLQRLYAPGDPARRADGNTGLPRLYPRFDRAGRRRTDAPTDRAACRAARDPEYRSAAAADANEVREAYKVIMALTDRPACLVLSRQTLPTFDRSRYAAAEGLARGAYVMAGAKDRKPDVILIA